MAKAWAPGEVTGMLERAGAMDTRPDHLAEGFGLTDDGYRLSPVQAKAILDLQLQRLTGLEQETMYSIIEMFMMGSYSCVAVLRRLHVGL